VFHSQRRRVLVTGSEGFIGRSLMARLERRGYEPVGYDLVHGNDVLDEAKLRDALVGVDAVIHLAGPSSARMFVESPEAASHTTVRGIQNVLAHFSGRVVFPSSSAAYGSADTACSERAALPDPSTLYASAKLTGERLCLDLNARGGNARIARLFPCYGPGEVSKGRYASALFHFANDMLSGRELIVYGNGEQKRDLLHVDDAVTGLVKLLETNSHEHIFNIGTGHSTMFAEVLEWLGRYTRRHANVVRRPAPQGYAAGCVADTTIARRELNFQATVSIERGLEDLVHAING
jgi:UDP-glucose 4-epimerase